MAQQISLSDVMVPLKIAQLEVVLRCLGAGPHDQVRPVIDHIVSVLAQAQADSTKGGAV